MELRCADYFFMPTALELCVRTGRRQSMPSISIDSRARVNDTDLDKRERVLCAPRSYGLPE